MEITGTIFKNATVKALNTEKSVVNFTVKVKRHYPLDGDKTKKSTFIDCSFFRTPKIAQHLTSGTVVTLNGDIHARAWKSANNALFAAINMRVDNIQFLGGGNAQHKQSQSESQPETFAAMAGADDLPF